MLLTSLEIKQICDAMKKDQHKVVVSLDLGLSQQSVFITDSFAVFPNGEKLDLRLSERIDAKSCYLIQNQKLAKVQLFSPATNRHYKLVPTSDWPTVTISGVPMHQKTRVTPKKDAYEKVNAIAIHGNVLDTCTGLGYTAILASEKADHVTTAEKDENILALARINPHSQALFERKNIEIVQDDIFTAIRTFNKELFDVIVHDPPTFKLAGELFGREFYRELYRVLKKDGWLFHYTGRFGIRSGRKFIDEVIKRLKEVGFINIKKVMDKQAVTCQKP